jgi:hypothetical protein
MNPTVIYSPAEIHELIRAALAELFEIASRQSCDCSRCKD